MAEHRPFPPSPRRRALARTAGLSGASPIATAAIGWVAATIAIAAIARTAASALGGSVAAACSGSATAVQPGAIVGAIAAVAGPLLGAVALAAMIAHVAQTGALWSPRRKIAGAPSLPAGAGPRVRRAGLELSFAAAIGAVGFGWLWTSAPRLAVLVDGTAWPSGDAAGREALLGAGATLVAGALTAFAIGYVVLGAIDALTRRLALGRALAMTAAERREDDRLSAADPRWRAARAAAARDGLGDAIAGARLVVLGDDLAVAVAWDPVRCPNPMRIASGRAARATQIIAYARRYQIAVHREPALATLVARNTVISEEAWPRLAEIIAACAGSDNTIAVRQRER